MFVQHVPFDFVVCEQSFPRIKPELSEDDIIVSMKSRDDQIRPSDDSCAALKELHDSVIQGIEKAQGTTGESDFITEESTAENAQILEYHTIGSFTRNCLLKDGLKVSFFSLWINCQPNTKVDISLVIGVLPTHETVGTVSRNILNQMKALNLDNADKVLLNSGIVINLK